MSTSAFKRRDFLKVAGASAAALGTPSARGVTTDAVPGAAPEIQPETKFPKLAIITRYSPAKLRFAASAGYEGVVIPLDEFFDPDRLKDSQIDEILNTAKDAGVRIISIECMWGMNHISKDLTERQKAQARFIRCLEFGHRLGCKFVGTFSGYQAGTPLDEQAKELAGVFNEKYLPVCERLDLSMGWENYPCDQNFATVPAAMEAVFAQVPSPRLGLEFDPSHFVRQYIDPIRAAWALKNRILAVHAKDTEIIEPVLQKVGIHGEGWWRYRIPGQGLIDWPAFITVLLQAGFKGGMAVEHEDEFWDVPGGNDQADFPQARKDGFILASRFLRMYLPGRLA
jgi:sugar phosphate isomerase/epimerase